MVKTFFGFAIAIDGYSRRSRFLKSGISRNDAAAGRCRRFLIVPSKTIKNRNKTFYLGGVNEDLGGVNEGLGGVEDSLFLDE